MLSLDPPGHTRLRRLVSGAFTPRRVAGLRPVIEATTARLLDDFPTDAGTDFISAFAFPAAHRGDRRTARGAGRRSMPSSSTWRASGPRCLDVTTPRILARGDAAAAEIRGYLADLAQQRRRRPQADLLSALLVGEGDERLTEDELLTMAALLFAAGFETATHLLGNGLVALLRHPGASSTSCGARPSWPRPRWRNCCGSTAPCRSPAESSCGTPRSAGVPVGAGQRLVVCLGAANHDPDSVRRPRPARPGQGGRRADVLRRRNPLLPGRAAGPAGGARSRSRRCSSASRTWPCTSRCTVARA